MKQAKTKYHYKLKHSKRRDMPGMNDNILVLDSNGETLIELILSNPIESGHQKYQLQRAIYFLTNNKVSEYNYVVVNCGYIDAALDDIDFVRVFFNEIIEDDKLKHIRRQLLIDKIV